MSEYKGGMMMHELGHESLEEIKQQQPTDTQMLYKFIMYLREHDYDVVELMQHKQRFLQYISNSNGE